MTSNTNICSPMERLDIVKHRGKVLPFQSCGGFSFAYTWRNWLGLTTDLDIVGLRHLGFYMFFTQTQQDCRLALFLWRNTACYKHGNIVFLLFSLLFSWSTRKHHLCIAAFASGIWRRFTLVIRLVELHYGYLALALIRVTFPLVIKV